MRRVAVIGAGFGGLSAARRLAGQGAEVTVFEKQAEVGGLVGSVEVAGTAVERFYHHLLPGEPDILELIDELGLGPEVRWFDSTIGMLVDGRIWPFTTPVDLLRFRPLGFTDRIRTGLGSLRFGRIDDWRALDDVAADEWLAELTGPRVADVVWKPLLRTKFGERADTVPAAWMLGRFRQRKGARRATGGERLGYLEGGFRRVLERLAADVVDRGAAIRTDAPVDGLVLDDRAVRGVRVDGTEHPADVVLYTGALPGIARLVPDELVDPRWTRPGLGCLCLLLELPARLTDEYWINVCDDAVGFGAIIEHTNLVPPAWYGGRHLVYLGAYYPDGGPVARTPTESLVDRWLGDLERVVPGFDRDDLLGLTPSRTSYAAPLVERPYLPLIPPAQTHLPGLHLATTAQIYPHDRGMSESVKTGAAAAATIATDLG